MMSIMAHTVFKLTNWPLHQHVGGRKFGVLGLGQQLYFVRENHFNNTKTCANKSRRVHTVKGALAPAVSFHA